MRESIYRSIVNEDSAATLLDRIEDDSGVPYVAADITSIVVTSYDLSTGGTLVYTTTISGSDVATHVLAISLVGWTTDDEGYNVRLPLSGEHWPEGGRTYRVEVRYVPVDGDPFLSLFELQSVEVFGS